MPEKHHGVAGEVAPSGFYAILFLHPLYCYSVERRRSVIVAQSPCGLN